MTRNWVVMLGLCVALVATTATLGQDRVSASEKGSLLVYPKVELRWDSAGNMIQDTFLDLTNDYPGAVSVQMYFVNGDEATDAVYDEGTGDLIERAHPGCNWLDNQIYLTANEPAFWSALTGQEKGVSPFTVLDPSSDPLAQGRPANDGTGDRVLRGFVLAWAVNSAGEEIRWNHLKGDAMVVNYEATSAWEYNAWAFAATTAWPHGGVLPTPGELYLDGVEYEQAFDLLLLDFYATGSTALSYGVPVSVDTDLTILPMLIDLRQDGEGPVTTKVKFDIWNQNEVKFSGTERCISCWDQELVGNYGVPNHFLREHLQTNKGKARYDGMASIVCDEYDPYGYPVVLSEYAPLLSVAAKYLDFNAGADMAMAGMNVVGMGYESGLIQADIIQGPPPEAPPLTEPAEISAQPVKPTLDARK